MRWDEYPPHMWATGREDMTERQSRLLWVLSNMRGTRLPFIERYDRNGQRVSKAEASILITKFRDNETVTQDFLLALGRTDAPEPLGHPSTWFNCHKPMTTWQGKWIEDIAEFLGIPLAATQRGTLGLTCGQASWLLQILRSEKAQALAQVTLELRNGEWFDNAVTLSMEEVPLPDEVDDPDYEPSDEEDEEDEESDDDMEIEVKRVELEELQLEARENDENEM